MVKVDPKKANLDQGAPHQIALAAILLASAILFLPVLWRAPRCTGPTQADVCPLAGKASVPNTSVPAYRDNK